MEEAAENYIDSVLQSVADPAVDGTYHTQAVLFGANFRYAS